MAFDPAENETILFGGSPPNVWGYDNYTWAYQNGTWVNLSLTTAPPGSGRMGLVYDVADGYLLAFGGISFETCAQPFPSCNSTWVFQSGHWRMLPTTHTPPLLEDGNDYVVGMAYDAKDGYVVLYDSVRNLWTDRPPREPGHSTPGTGRSCSPGPGRRSRTSTGLPSAVG